MNTGKTLFAQVMEFVPWTSFSRIVQRYNADSGVRRLSCAEQFRIMAFASRVIRDWIGFYNQKRPHQALRMQTPNHDVGSSAVGGSGWWYR